MAASAADAPPLKKTRAATKELTSPTASGKAAASPVTKQETRTFPTRGVALLDAASAAWQMQVAVRCHEVGYPPTETYGYGADSRTRKLVIAGNTSVFDLLKATLVSFGLNPAGYDHRPGLGKLNVGRGSIEEMVAGKLNKKNAILMSDLHLVGDPANNDMHAAGKIDGLHPAKPAKGACDLAVSAADLKKAMLCQVLDRPACSTDVRSADEGMRRGLYFSISLPERLAFCSRVTGGCWNQPVRQSFYDFSVTLEAVGTKAHMASNFQERLPRCVGGQGKVYGGNEMDWFWGEEEDHRCWKLAECDCVNAKLNNGRQIRRFVCGYSGDADEDVFAVSGWLCKPLFDVDYVEGTATCVKDDLKERRANSCKAFRAPTTARPKLVSRRAIYSLSGGAPTTAAR